MANSPTSRNSLSITGLNAGKQFAVAAIDVVGNVSAVGQKDLVAGRAHLWVRNVAHSWWNVVNGVPWGRLTGQVSAPGIGAPSPSLVSILRRTPDGGQVNICVDLRRAIPGLEFLGPLTDGLKIAAVERALN